MPRLTPASDRAIAAPLTAALAEVGVETLVHPLLEAPVATLDADGVPSPTDALLALPAALERAARVREWWRTITAGVLGTAMVALPLAGAIGGRSLAHALLTMRAADAIGLLAGGVVGLVAASRVRRLVAGVVDPALATMGPGTRLARDLARWRALDLFVHDGPLTAAAMATARAALASQPPADDPEVWEALRDALAECRVESARARSRVPTQVTASVVDEPDDATAPAPRGTSAAPAGPVVATVTPASAAASTPHASTPATLAGPADAVLTPERAALLAALQSQLPVRASRPRAPAGGPGPASRA